MENLLLEDKKRKLLENINYAKSINMNKISAVLVNDNKDITKEIVSWLIFEGYKVALIKDEVDILNIEW